MADLADMEVSYYRANQASKLGEPEQPFLCAHPYPNHTFKQWVRKQDIYALGKDKADFYLDEAIVREFEDYRSKVTMELAKCVQYDGIKLKGQTRKTAGTAENPAANKVSFVTSRLRW